MDLVTDHPFTRIEFDWVAHDLDGHIAYLTTGGVGPIPSAAIEDAALLEDIHEKMIALPPTTAVTVVGGPLNNFDWFEVARRGVFAYDWSREQEAYVLVVAPVAPLLVRDLSGSPLRETVGHVRLPVRFRTMAALRATMPPASDSDGK